jgi:hypothetical protein
MINLFLQATREKFRFQSSKGDLSVEQLWDLPLTSRTGFDLDTVAKAVNADLKGANEESFVNTSNNPAVSRLQAKLELVKAIIEIKLAEADAAKKRSEKAAERQRLMEVLHSKKDQELQGLSVEEIEKRLAQLD